MIRSALAAIALLAASCAPPTLPARPLPASSSASTPEVIRSNAFFPGAHGTSLFEQSWRPAAAPRATVVIHHGLKSHSEHYHELATRLVARGLAVHAYDMRGHGRSAGARASLDDFDDLVADLAGFVERVRVLEEDRPVFVIGHSVGGAVVSLYVVERKPRIAGFVLLAPAIRIDRSMIEAAATPLTAALSPNLPVVDVPDEAFSRDPAVVAEMGRDPLVYHPAGPARTAAALLVALERIWAGVDAVDTPVLALHGTADRATDPRGSAELVRRVRAKDRTLRLYRGLFHDLVREPERDQVMTDIAQWLDERAR